MKLYNDFTLKQGEKSCVSFGHFDGMHVGHKAVIQRLCSHSELKPILLSFSEETKPIIYSEVEKAYLLSKMCDAELVSAQTSELEKLSAEEFASEVLTKKLHAAAVVVGENAVIGNDQISADDFAELGKKYGFSVEKADVIKVENEIVSSSLIKTAIQAGDFTQIQALLGHDYLINGMVVHGKAAGRKFGMPTANLGVPKNKLFPPHGVYGSNSLIEGETYRGMTNIGLRPSDDNIPIPSIETFILNFDRDIYGKEVFLELLVYIRGVKTFKGGLAEVRKQIDHDIEQVKEYMKNKK